MCRETQDTTDLYWQHHKAPRIPKSDDVNTFVNYGMSTIEVVDYRHRKGITTPFDPIDWKGSATTKYLAFLLRSKAPWE